MNRQQIFDRVATHLLSQMAPSIDEGSCAYRDRYGRMCAVGCLISDEDYRPDMEGCNAYGLLEFQHLPAHILHETDFLQSLQDIHDGRKPETWREKLQEFAAVNGLNTDALK